MSSPIPPDLVGRIDQGYAEGRAELASLVTEARALLDEYGPASAAALFSAVTIGDWDEHIVRGLAGLAVMELARREVGS